MKSTSKFFLVTLVFISVAAHASGQSGASDAEVWGGPQIEFVKADGADPTVAANQDRITDSVWITRTNAGGQIFNIQERNRPSKVASPVGTQWAVGTTADLENLRFGNFRRIVDNPKDVVGMELVLHIVEENIYIDIQFTSWSQGKAGGFAYTRSTPE